MPPVEVPQRLVAAAVGGDRDALEELLRLVADDVARLARRMLWHPQDAEDATQEILVKVATRLGGFRGDARVTTWVHRIAVNHLLTTRRRRAEDPTLTFAAFGQDLAEGLDLAYDARGVDEDLLAEEVRVGCTQGMLLCLDRELRIAYVLGEVLGFSSEDAADVCAIIAGSVPQAARAGPFAAGRIHARPLRPARSRQHVSLPAPHRRGRGQRPARSLRSALRPSRRRPQARHGDLHATPARSSAATQRYGARRAWSTLSFGPSRESRSPPQRRSVVEPAGEGVARNAVWRCRGCSHSPTEQERDPAEVLAEDLFVVAEQRLGARRDHALGRGHAGHARCVVTKQSCNELHLRANLRHQFQAHDHAGATRDPAGGARFVANRLVTVRQDLPAAAIEKAIPLTLNDGERNVSTSADDEIAHAVAPVQNAQRCAASKAESREAARNQDRKHTVHPGREADGTHGRQRDHRAQLRQSDRLPPERPDKRVVSAEQILGERDLVQRP